MEGTNEFFMSGQEALLMRRLLLSARTAFGKRIVEEARHLHLPLSREAQDNIFDLIRLFSACESLYCRMANLELNIKEIAEKYQVSVSIDNRILADKNGKYSNKEIDDENGELSDIEDDMDEEIMNDILVSAEQSAKRSPAAAMRHGG